MRTFIAIELSDEIKDSLAQAQEHLKYSGADVKWVERENIHLTLKFVGEIDEKRCESVKSVLDTIARDTKAFEISLKDLGAFPSEDFPRVVWAGLDKGAEESSAIAAKIETGLSAVGFEKEKHPFSAHLTIGRVRSPHNKKALQEKFKSCSLKLATQPVSSIILFQSKLTPTGPIYSILHESKLA